MTNRFIRAMNIIGLILWLITVTKRSFQIRMRWEPPLNSTCRELTSPCSRGRTVSERKDQSILHVADGNDATGSRHIGVGHAGREREDPEQAVATGQHYSDRERWVCIPLASPAAILSAGPRHRKHPSRGTISTYFLFAAIPRSRDTRVSA